MLIAKKISKYLLNQYLSNFSHLYICSRSFCYLKFDTQTKSVTTKKEKISADLKKTIKMVEKYLMINNDHFDIFLDENTDDYNGICIIKIENNRYAVFTNKNFINGENLNSYLKISEEIKKFIIR